jgi:methylisocitrate lyase
MESREEFERFARALPGAVLLANMTEFGKSPNLDVKELGDMGYRLILFPLTAFRVAMKAAEDTLRDLLANGVQSASLPKMQTRAELYDLLGYTGYEARDRAYFGTPKQGGS